MKTEHELLKEISDLIWYKKWEIICWGCMRKDWLQYSWKTKWKDWICGRCWFEWKDIWLLSWNLENEYWYKRWSIKEIIFTPEFMDKFIEYYQMQWWQELACDIWATLITCKLNNPVSYLANILNIK